MACRAKDTTINPAVELIAEQGFEGLSEAVTLLINQAMQIERAKHLEADPYERTEQRNGYANGYKPKTVKTRLGELELHVPQVRDSSFYPSALERGLRSERALKLALAQMYVQGVATRKVKAITEELCGFEVTSMDVSRAAKLLDDSLEKWRKRPLGGYRYIFVDARYEKVRREGCVVDSAVLIAFGINETGCRTILGVSVSLSEAEVHWRDFFNSLVERGLHGIELIISDAHSGLKAARKAVFPSVPWQRCQFHLQQNAQSHVPKQHMKRPVAADIRSILQAPNQAEANRLLAIIVKKYQESAPKLSEWMENNIPESLTIMQFPEPHRRRIRTSNLAERVNKEIRRRTRVASIFPNTDSCLRLVTAVIVEIDEEWQQGHTYLSMDD
jgi:transposase-like protein